MKLLQLIIIVIILASCSTKVERESLIGTYSFSTYDKDRIEVRIDGTYTHFSSTAEGELLEQSGTWKLNSSGNKIQFENFSFLINGSKGGNWFSKIRIDDKGLQLIYASEENIYYQKIK